MTGDEYVAIAEVLAEYGEDIKKINLVIHLASLIGRGNSQFEFKRFYNTCFPDSTLYPEIEPYS